MSDASGPYEKPIDLHCDQCGEYTLEARFVRCVDCDDKVVVCLECLKYTDEHDYICFATSSQH